MNVHDPWRDRLSEYLDGDLDAAERAALDQHLAGCGECRATLDELRDLVALARNLEDRPPPRDLWAGIHDRIQAAAVEGTAERAPATAEEEPALRIVASSAAEAVPRYHDPRPPAPRRQPLRRFAFTIPQLAAAGITLILLTAGTIWLLGSEYRREGSARLAGRDAPGGDAAVVDSPGTIRLAGDIAGDLAGGTAAGLAGGQYDAAIADLELALAEGRQYLAPATVEILEENLATIDRAIEEARRALAEDPANIYLANYLADTMMRKLELLRYTNTIVRAQS